MIENQEILNNTENPVETQYVDENGNPVDPSLVDENGNMQIVEYVDENGNPIDPSLIDENGNYIGEQKVELTQEQITEASTSAKAMDDKELLTGMVTFDYNNVPITDIVNSIILDSINKGASDIHFDPFPEGIKIRIRIDGQLHDYSIVPLYVKNNMITRIKIISSMNITESRMPQDGAIRTELANKTIDLRVACLPTSMGEKIVLRIMDYSMSSNGVEGLDFSPKNLEKVNKMLALPNGIILVTGATGTGKSTTVYSMLQVLNTPSRNIITVEDPIEMNIGGINQVQAQEEIGLNFAEVLRSILREDPDVIMIGEIRDDETARIAIRASITGHLVISTIHTNNSLNTIERLSDMSVERYLLGSSLEGIISQRLARRLCPNCKKKRPTTEYERTTFQKALNQDIREIYIPQGCPECDGGYRGRIAIHEVLAITQEIRDAITKGADKATLRNLVYNLGETDTMLQDGLQKVLLGETSFDEILKLIDLEDDLGSNTKVENITEQNEITPENNTPQPNGFIPYPVPMQFDPKLMKEFMELMIKENKEQDESKEEKITEDTPQVETIPEITKVEETPAEDEELESLKTNNYDNLENNELSTEEIPTENLSNLDEEEDIQVININVPDDYKRPEIKAEKEEKPVVTLTLDESNTVKPTPISIDDTFEVVPINKKGKNKKNIKNKKNDKETTTNKSNNIPKSSNNSIYDLNPTNSTIDTSVKDDFEMTDEELNQLLGIIE